MVLQAVRALVQSPNLDLDDGGLRIERAGQRSYLPFASLEAAKLVNVLGRVSLLVKVAGGWRRFALAHLSPSVALATVLGGIEASAAPSRPLARELARSSRDVFAWLDDVDAVVTTGGYRSAPLKTADLAKTVAASSAPIDERAAAAYALLAHGELDHVVAVARALRGDPPPLFLALVACAPGGLVLVPRNVVDDVLPFLDDADRRAIVERLARRCDEAAEARAKEAISIVLEEEANAIAKGAANAGKRRVRLHGSGTDPMIGRTWAY